MLLYRVLRKNSLLHQTNAKSLVKSVSSATFRSNYSSNSGKNNDHIAFDFGTSKINVATMDENNQPKVIHTQPFLLPVTLSLGPEYVHDEVIITVRHLIGRKFDDSLVQQQIKGGPFHIDKGPLVKTPNGDVRLEKKDGRLVSPTILLQEYFEKAKKEAESRLGKSVCRAVITHPSVFNGEQLRETVKEGLGAGFELIHTIDETTATAIAYGMHKKEKGRLFVVVDIGYRSFDVTLMEISDGGKIKFKCPTKSDMYFGGDDFDIALLDYFVSAYNVSDESKSFVRANMWGVYTGFAERHKKILSSEFEVELKYPLIIPGQPPKNLIEMKLSRSTFERVVNPLILRIKSQIENYLEEIGTNPMDIDEILLVGGMGKVPKVRKVISEIFRKIPSRGVNDLDAAVALGAAAAVEAGYFGEDPWNNN